VIHHYLKEYRGLVLVFGLLPRILDIWPEDLREVLLHCHIACKLRIAIARFATVMFAIWLAFTAMPAGRRTSGTKQTSLFIQSLFCRLWSVWLCSYCLVYLLRWFRGIIRVKEYKGALISPFALMTCDAFICRCLIFSVTGLGSLQEGSLAFVARHYSYSLGM
jgi:hypothetical protein